VTDSSLKQLQKVSDEFEGRVVTSLWGSDRMERLTAVADVVIGAVLIPGQRTPYMVTEEMVSRMKTGSVIVDLSIDQGGCVETSRPMTLDHPTFTAHGVVHYCVPNMPANVARTASRALANSSLPYLLALAQHGVRDALLADPGLAQGAYLFEGEMVHEGVASITGIPCADLGRHLKEVER
jgi:alanine dehydrogenase